MFPYVPQGRGVPAPGRRAAQIILSAAAALGRDEQPEVYRHVHPHGRATATLARSFADAVCHGVGPSLDEVALGAHLHDFGKYLIPRSVLLKPGPLSEDERAVVSRHPVYGAQVLSGLTGITETVRLVVLYHHERWDGGGYPEGLQGTRIPFAARLVSVADVYASLRAKRSYKPTLTSDFLKFIGCLRRARTG